MNFDDPIVFPGQPGRSHLHVFFGNTGTNANSTAASIANSGNSTCAGGTLNRTAYWAPAIIDTKDGSPVKPASSIFYYKTGEIINARSVKALPAGLRMVSGDPSRATPGGASRYACVGPNEAYWQQSIPNCRVGSDMIMEVHFPQCWDGVNLDSPDHRSHMNYPTGAGVCPGTHPVPVPLITLEIHYKITVANSQLTWRLSSDSYDRSLPAGYSGHGDWFNGWDMNIQNTFIQNCENAAMDCHAFLLGDGRTLY